MRRTLVLAALSAVAVASVIVLPASVAGAAGSVLWVNGSAAVSSAPGSNCAHPGYNSIQSAINAAAPGAVIDVCPGTYTEQLSITKSLTITAKGSVTAALPATPSNDTTACDNAVGVADGTPPQEEISICGASVNLNSIGVTAFWPALTGCAGNLSGIFVGAGANLTANKVSVNGGGNPIGDPNFGCQHGVGIAVGTSETTPNEAATASLASVTVSNFQKDGIRADGTGTVLSINKATVAGPGPAAIGQNGIEVLYGAKANVSGANVSNLECNLAPPDCGPDGLNNYQADGALFYGAAAGSTLEKSTFTHNDVGIYYGSDSATEPASSQLLISGNTLTSNRYIGIQLDQGKATLTSNKINGTGNVGIQVIQYINNAFLGTQTYAPAETASSETISGQQVGVQVDSDQNPADFPGTFTISKSHFLTGNVVGETDNSLNLFIGGVKNT